VPDPSAIDRNATDEVNKVRSLMYASDHRDSMIDKKIPSGYKIIGVKGFRNTYDGVVLHVADFIIWKPPIGWLDISPEGEAKRERARIKALNLHNMGLTGATWNTNANKQKNFLKLNHARLRTQQETLSKLKQK